MPVDFRAHAAGAPAEIADHIRAVSDGLPGPKAHLAGLWRRLHHAEIPSPWPGLLFHDAKNGGNAAHPGQIKGAVAVLHAVSFSRFMGQVVGKIGVVVITCLLYTSHRLLKGIADAELCPLCDSKICDVLSVQQYAAGSGLFDPRNDLGQRGFSASVAVSYTHLQHYGYNHRIWLLYTNF